jgi:hypothetical protein
MDVVLVNACSVQNCFVWLFWLIFKIVVTTVGLLFKLDTVCLCKKT